MLDFHELNHFVDCHTGNDGIDNYDEMLRESRQISADVSILESVYIQIKINKDLLKYQIV